MSPDFPDGGLNRRQVDPLQIVGMGLSWEGACEIKQQLFDDLTFDSQSVELRRMDPPLRKQRMNALPGASPGDPNVACYVVMAWL